jgi:hypothetical protein
MSTEKRVDVLLMVSAVGGAVFFSFQLAKWLGLVPGEAADAGDLLFPGVLALCTIAPVAAYIPFFAFLLWARFT